MAAETKIEGNLVLVGDSVLEDNGIWLLDPLDNITKHTREEFKDQLNVINYAVDEMLTTDMEVRDPSIHPWTRYAFVRKDVYKSGPSAEYAIGPDGCIRTFDLVANVKNVKHIVLSIGGNDLYLGDKTFTPGYFSSFEERYDEVCTKLIKAGKSAQLIVIIPYRPHRDWSLMKMCRRKKPSDHPDPPMDEIFNILTQKLLTVAIKHKASVIDLSRTFDPNDATHYSTGDINVSGKYSDWTGVEPSSLSSKFIAKAIRKAVDTPVPVLPNTINVISGITPKVTQLGAEDIANYKFGPDL